MKINEIAINENKYDLIRKALPRIEKLPGETMKDAITRAKSELGGVKSADNLVSPEEMAALRRDPVPSSGPVAGTDPSTGFLVPGRVIPTQANTSYNLNLPKTPAAADAVPSSGPAVWRGRGDSVPGRAPPTASWVKPQVWRGRPPSEPVALSQQNPTTGPAAINFQAAERMRQAAAAKRAPKAPAGPDMGPQSSAAAGGGPGVHPDWSKPPPASGTTAPPPVININTGKESSWWPGWKTKLTAAAAGPWAYNNLSPKDYPKIPDSVADWPVNLYTAGKNNLLNNRGAKDLKDLTGIEKVEPTPTVVKPGEQPTQTQVDKVQADDTDNQKASKRVDDWNRDHPDDPIKESYTNELNRLVYLSRL